MLSMVAILISKAFLSTLSLRRATTPPSYKHRIHHISIHALLAESDVVLLGVKSTSKISIHALLAESDYKRTSNGHCLDNFYPRSPCGERQNSLVTLVFQIPYFYPRSPCGERPFLVQLGCKSFLFLSTLSLRRATTSSTRSQPGKPISIHALLAESDGCSSGAKADSPTFLSTLSLRRATRKVPILGIK